MLKQLFEAIDDRLIEASTSELTLAEALAKPLASGATELVATYESALAPDSAIRTVPIDRAVLRSAAALQGKLGIKLHDAIHVATAQASGCHRFMTNDSRLGRKLGADIAWLSLDDVERRAVGG